MKEKVNHTLILMIISFSLPLTGACIDIHAPGLPHIISYFHTTRDNGQASIYLYLLGLSIGVFFFGLAADYLSLKHLYIYSTLLFILFCIASIVAPTTQLFLLTRFLQGVAVSGPSTISKKYLGVIYSGDALTKASSTVAIFWSLGPVMAPVLGGYLANYTWKLCFIFLAIYALIPLTLGVKNLPKSKPHASKVTLNKLIKNTIKILTHASFIGITVVTSMTYAFSSIYNTIAPFIIQTTMGKSPTTYGHVGLILGVTWLLGNITNNFLIKYYKNYQILITCLTIMIIAGLSLIIGLPKLPLTLLSVLFPVMFFFFLGGILMSYGLSMSLDTFPGLEGTVTAIRTCLCVLITAILCFTASHLSINNQLPLIEQLTIMVTIGLSVYLLLSYRKI